MYKIVVIGFVHTNCCLPYSRFCTCSYKRTFPSMIFCSVVLFENGLVASTSTEKFLVQVIGKIDFNQNTAFLAQFPLTFQNVEQRCLNWNTSTTGTYRLVKTELILYVTWPCHGYLWTQPFEEDIVYYYFHSTALISNKKIE